MARKVTFDVEELERMGYVIVDKYDYEADLESQYQKGFEDGRAYRDKDKENIDITEYQRGFDDGYNHCIDIHKLDQLNESW